MKKLLCWLAVGMLSLSLVNAAESGLKLDEKLAGLEKFLGTWEAREENGTESVSYTLEAAAGGKAVILTGKANDGGRINAIWYFDPVKKNIVHNGVNSAGEIWSRIYPAGMADSEFRNNFFHTSAEGVQMSAIELVKWIDKDTWTLTVTEVHSGGRKQARSPKIILKRVRS